MDKVEIAIAQAVKTRMKLYDNSYISAHNRHLLFRDVAELVQLKTGKKLSAYEVAAIWKSLRGKFTRAQLRIIRRQKLSSSQTIIHQRLIFLKTYVSHKEKEDDGNDEEKPECGKECYQFDNSSGDEDKLCGLGPQQAVSLSPSTSGTSGIKIKEEHGILDGNDYDRIDGPAEPLKIENEPSDNNAPESRIKKEFDSPDIITISDSDSEEESKNVQLAHKRPLNENIELDIPHKVQNIVPSKKQKSLMYKDTPVKGKKDSGSGLKNFNCNFPKNKSSKNNQSNVQAAISNLQLSITNLRHNQSIAQYADVINNRLKLFPEEDRIIILLHILDIISSFKN